ncbi:MAG: GNAT family N-acetyltransferase [Betaproteobacteria bacterium]|nr:GNAT family N-acetyltransferase [Betaproteobacteria bacterium]
MSPTAFPTPHAIELPVRHALFAATWRLRGARGTDEPALRALYASTREDELAAAPWPPAVTAAFLDHQFALQHHHYVTHFPEADFLVIESPDGIAGRLYRERVPEGAPAGECDAVIDVCLLPAWRRRGVGTSLLRAVMEEATGRGRGVALQVLARNDGARRLYERLGFAVSATNGAHLAMRWRAAPG